MDTTFYDNGTYPFKEENAEDFGAGSKEYVHAHSCPTEKCVTQDFELGQGLIYFVGIKRLHDDLEVTAAKVYVTAAKLKLLMLLVYKLLLLVLEVNAASTKVTIAQRLRLLKEFLLSRDG
ncbi:hypothetical protein Tco_0603122 [Tanacetum coccineum]